MHRMRRLVILLAAAAGWAAAQPALTTIQDILYRADGTRFSGTVNIRWNSFLSGGGSSIATSNVTLQIVNGVLRVRLVPTTTASPGAQYGVTYNSQGQAQFTESWAVPPNTLSMRVRDVRLTLGSVVGPAAVVSPIQIGDVVGLTNALNVRPTVGVGFAIGRTALINTAGQLDGAAGNLGDCVRVDGSSGACGGGAGGVVPSFVDGEIPGGAVNGANTSFTLINPPSPVSSLILYRNGLYQRQGVDYLATGSAITFFTASLPQIGDLLTASYRYANPNNPLGSLTTPQVICSNTGTSTGALSSTQLGSCTIPAGLLGAGDRLEVQFQLAHTGSATSFAGEIRMGATPILTRTATSADTTLAGRLGIGVYAGGQMWDAHSWGNALAHSTAAGSAGENTSASLTFSFRGQIGASGADTVALRNFTVVRYPAQSNP